MMQVSVFFISMRIVCFIVFVLFIIYLFKKYILVELKKIKHHEEQATEQLFIEQETVKETMRLLHNETLQQKQKTELLLEKLKLWNFYITQKKTQEQINAFHIQKQIKQYVVKQIEGIFLEKGKQIVIPDALKKAEQELKTHFSNANEQKLFLQKSISFLEQRNLS